MLRWSKLRKVVRGRFAESVSKRVGLYSTHYRRAHDQDGRAWITIDREIVYTADTAELFVRLYGLQREFKAVGLGAGDPAPRGSEAEVYSEDVLLREGTQSQYDFYQSLEQFLQSSIQDALASRNVVVRALAMVDRRLGKRRLATIRPDQLEHQLVKRMYLLRLQGEGLSPRDT